MNSVENYIKANGFGAAARLSRDSGLAPPVVSKLRHGRMAPSLVVALRLHVASKGKISIIETFPTAVPLIQGVAELLLQEAA